MNYNTWIHYKIECGDTPSALILGDIIRSNTKTHLILGYILKGLIRDKLLHYARKKNNLILFVSVLDFVPLLFMRKRVAGWLEL